MFKFWFKFIAEAQDLKELREFYLALWMSYPAVLVLYLNRLQEIGYGRKTIFHFILRGFLAGGAIIRLSIAKKKLT